MHSLGAQPCTKPMSFWNMMQRLMSFSDLNRSQHVPSIRPRFSSVVCTKKNCSDMYRPILIGTHEEPF